MSLLLEKETAKLVNIGAVTVSASLIHMPGTSNYI